MNEELAALSVQGSEENVPFVRAEKNLQPLGNIWVSLEFLKSGKSQFAENDFLLQSEICDFENRTGVALDKNKHTVEGQLYSSSHVRLLDGVALIFALSKDAGLLDKGKILLGGEKRVSLCKKITEDLLAGFSFDSDNFLSLAPIRAAEEILKSVVASGKLEITSGWDLTKGFHKPTESWIPAGAVFTKNINGTCVPLKKI